MDQNLPFGVVMIKKGQEALGPLAEPYDVGCTVKIMDTEKLSGGRMKAFCKGEDRFRIVELDRSGQYLVGRVEKFDYPEDENEDIVLADERLRPLVERYVQILNDAKLLAMTAKNIPLQSEEMAFWAAQLMQVSMEQKQPLLESASISEMMIKMAIMYKREITLVKSMIDAPDFGEGPGSRVN
jgi:Lon protease-like protein